MSHPPDPDYAIFEDRRDAGRRLATAVRPYADPNTIVLGLPRGGVVVAAEIARELGAPLDVLIVRKIGAPDQPELALGAVVDLPRPHMILNEETLGRYDLSREEIEARIGREIAEIERRRLMYRKGRAALDPAGKTVIVVDDGVATGASIRVALKALRGGPASRIILAVPVAPPQTLARLRQETDEVICLSAPADFIAVGAHYRDFTQTTDEEVIALLSEPPLAQAS